MEKQSAVRIEPILSGRSLEVESEYGPIVTTPILNSPTAINIYSQKINFGPRRLPPPRVHNIVKLKIETFDSNNTDNSVIMKQDFAQTSVLKPKQLLKMNHNVRWHWPNFFEFFFYHIIYFFLLGPLINLFFWYKPGLILLRNMDFFGLSAQHAVQLVIYVTNMYCSITYFMTGNFQISEIFYLWAVIFNLSLIISFKYATLSPDMIKILKLHDIKKSVRNKLQYLLFYTPQSNEVRYCELFDAFKRHQFESSLFYVTFFTEIDPIFAGSINTLNLTLEKYHKHKSNQYQPNALIPSKQQFYGFGIANKLIQVYENQTSWKVPMIYAIMLSVGLSVIPIGFLGYQGLHNKQGYQLFQLILIVLTETYCGSVCLVFLFISLRDVRKKKYFLVQCGFMISPRKAYWDSKKIIPTLNITDIQSIMAWSMLRQIFFDYGKQYTIRTQAFCSFVIFYCALDSFFITLYFFAIMEIDKFSMIYLIATDIIFGVMIILILVEQAYLNQFFDIYRNLIEDWINIILDIQRMQIFYFEKEKVPNNYLHRKIVELISQRIDNIEDSKEVDQSCIRENELIGDDLCNIQKTLEDALRHLDYDKRNYSWKFYGFVVTFEKLWALVAFFGTIIGFNINYWFKYK